MSDTTLNATESGMLADIRLHDIVVGVDGSDEFLRRITLGAERGIAYRPAGQCGVRMVPFLGYGLGTGR